VDFRTAGVVSQVIKEFLFVGDVRYLNKLIIKGSVQRD